jgi:hypothetical protein
MSRCTLLRYAVPALLAAALLPAAAFAQSQDSQSVAEAARRAREKKKAQAKPANVITDETLDVKKGDVQSATAEVPKIPGTPAASAQTAGTAPAAGAAAAANASATPTAKDGKEPKELTELKEKVKQAESDLDLLNREYRLDQDAYFSKPDYADDAEGKQKLDDEKVQIGNKQQEVDRLKAKLADLLQLLGIPASAPPPPQP